MGAAPIGTATTNASGAFTVFSYTCPAGNPQTFITASGGNAGSGTNSAIGLMAVLGPCKSLSTSTHVTINELTTAAAQWALAQFFDSTGHTIGAPSTNATGLKNAYTGFANLAGVNSATLSVSGNPASFVIGAGTCQLESAPASCDPLNRLNTLANILAGCIESSGSSSSACAQLMCDATPGDIYTSSCSGTPTITDTIGAAHLIVTHPANNVGTLYGLASVSTPFSPALTAAPDGWEIALNFAPSAAAFSNPYSIALDGSGNVFAVNFAGNSVSELTAASGYATGLDFAPPSAFNGPISLAPDVSGNVFVANFYNSNVSELTAASSYATAIDFAPTGAAIADPLSIALDGSGNIFAANCGSGCSGSGGSVSELTTSSGYSAGLNFNPAGASFEQPESIQLDGSGNVFAEDSTSNSVSELTASSNYDTGLNFAPAGAIRNPVAIALDASDNVFVGNSGNSTVSELTAASSYATGLNFSPAGAALEFPFAIALDGSGNVFVANFYDGVSELTAASSYSAGFDFAAAGAQFSEVVSIALDESGNVFVANYNGSVNGSLSELLGLAKPVITPVQGCVVFWKNHPGQACVP